MASFNRPSVADFQGENVFAQVAQKHWLSTSKPVTRATPAALKELWDPLEKADFTYSSLLLLENLQALERFLWPSFSSDSSNHHILLIALLVNVKRRESLPSWSLFEDRPADFSALFRRTLALLLDTNLSISVRTHVLVSVIGAFQSLESGLIRKECAPLVSVAIWHNLHSETAIEDLLSQNAQFKKAWRAVQKRHDAADAAAKARQRFERSWLYELVLDFLDLLYNPQRRTKEARRYCERMLEFLTDLQSQFPTRRYVNTLLKDLNLLVAIKHSPLYRGEAADVEDTGLFRDFYLLLRHYTSFPIDDHTGRLLPDSKSEHRSVLARLQRTALLHFKEKLNLLVLANYGVLGKREELQGHFEALTDEELTELAQLLGHRTSYPKTIALIPDRQFLKELLIFRHEYQPPYKDVIRKMTLLPTEKSLYEPALLRNERYDGSRPMALPKLNLQYLATGDFLWRSFILYRCESFYGLRTYLEDTIKVLRPKKDMSGSIKFSGSSRMALKIPRPAIIEIVPPRVGAQIPSEVRAEVILDMTRLNDNVRAEWESLRNGDTVFLVGGVEVAQTNGVTTTTEQLPYRYLRCAEIIDVLNDHGKPIRYQEHQSNGTNSRHRKRRLLVRLDAEAYHRDVANKNKGQPDVYESIDLVIRRRKRENLFKPMLASIQRLVLSDVPMPIWLQDVFLGLGDPAGAHYKSMSNALQSLDFRDTFLDWQHLLEALPTKELRAVGTAKRLDPPYVLTSATAQGEHDEPSRKKRQNGQAHAPGQTEQSEQEKSIKPTKVSKKRRHDEIEEGPDLDIMSVSTYSPPNMGPYPTDLPKINTVRFTASQVEAINSGTQPGLTVIVGPPGTGKTDVATQIINNIYHNFPTERILLVTHSNQALNQLFQKIVALDIDKRHLLRLGHGEGDLQLETDASFGKHGRVESLLAIASGLLAEVDRLATSLNAPGAHGSSCETASYFFGVYVLPLWKTYSALLTSSDSTREEIVDTFPFYIFFANAPQPIFPPNADKDSVIEIATGAYRHINKIFTELEDIRPFEVLRHERDKANYLLVKEARIIAMTSTHAAIQRQEIAALGFRYDNVIMEEAAQITEIEAFIPMALQKPQDGQLDLKRIVLCGDHLQNSPIVSNMAFRQYANLEQSLFQRLVRLGVPTITLDKQGRARSSIASLYKWRYKSLGNLPIVESAQEFQTANAGFRYDYQFIDVPDYKDKGETQPNPHFIQNLGEAEYAVALYMYMRLLGYEASKISILTTYAGQRALIRDVLNHRCAKNRLFGLPKIVATVDKYQGEQNDYVILSLVRTTRVGYLRDIRRLTVALSRARLGLYILGRRDVFTSCMELTEATDRLCERPEKLQLVTGEMFPTKRLVNNDVENTEMDGVEHLGQYVFEMTQAKVKALKEGGGVLPPLAETRKDDEDDVGDGVEVESSSEESDDVESSEAEEE